jgi:flagellar biosynthesis GTPase FlhF
MATFKTTVDVLLAKYLAKRFADQRLITDLLTNALDRDTTRDAVPKIANVLTFDGDQGTGKTTVLALLAAAFVAHQRDGVVFLC